MNGVGQGSFNSFDKTRRQFITDVEDSLEVVDISILKLLFYSFEWYNKYVKLQSTTNWLAVGGSHIDDHMSTNLAHIVGILIAPFVRKSG